MAIDYSAFRTVECTTCGKEFVRELSRNYKRCVDCREESVNPQSKISDLAMALLKNIAAVFPRREFTIKDIVNVCNPRKLKTEACRAHLNWLIENKYVNITYIGSTMKNDGRRYRLRQKNNAELSAPI